jgi:virulence-associated protein VapD
MAQFAIAFDLDTVRMKADGLSESDRTRIYQTELPKALSKCGFTEHPQGSLYHTNSEHDPIIAIIQLQSILKTDAPQFCKYVNKIHVFRMDHWSDVTSAISTNVSSNIPEIEIIKEQEFITELALSDSKTIPVSGEG